MKDKIMGHLDDPHQLEKLYREDKPVFISSFRSLYPTLQGNVLADYWNIRLSYDADTLTPAKKRDVIFVVVASAVAGLIAKLPSILSVDPEFFFTRNIGFVLFPLLAVYFAWRNSLAAGKAAFIAGAMLAGLLFINVYPDVKQTDTLVLSCLHLVLFLWSLLGVTFVGDFRNVPDKRLGFLKYNGDLVVITTLIVIAGGILSGITIGLFSIIGLSIEQFYFENIVVFTLPAAPILGTYLTQSNPQLVGKVSPLIARIFSPLVLIMLSIYLSAMAFSGKDPFNDREFLIIFNVLLIGVMAIIFFSIAEKSNRNKAELWVLFLLSLITVLVNGIAFSAIMFRIAEWGITPNRAAVLGGNILILVNLVLVNVKLFQVVRNRFDLNAVGHVIAAYLPVYFIWTIVVTFLFPFIFGF
jgi:hypothetical protein